VEDDLPVPEVKSRRAVRHARSAEHALGEEERLMRHRGVGLTRAGLLMAIALVAGMAPAEAQAPAKKPNILVMWGDDIGQSNLSVFTKGMMGYRTPNIDRIANEGMLFTDYYAEQSCTAGRAAFIMGQSVFRSGLSKVGLPGAAEGMRAEDPTIAEILKPLGYATGQFGKNHLGDRDEQLPTMHGFDEFFGNLYHLNAEEEPELRDYPTDKDIPGFRQKYGPRGVLHTWANPDGTQKIDNTGPLTKKRMETVDDEFLAGAVDFIKRQNAAGKPFFVWFNTTGMHLRTHAKPSSLGQSGRWQSEYHDAMIDHDKRVGELLKLLDDLGIANDTFVMYSTDNGPHRNTWPDAGMTPFRNEKNSNWEGAYRVPAMVRWPGQIKPGQVSNEIMSHLDWLPTFAAMAGDADVKDKLLKGHQAGSKTFKVHLDGYNQLPYLTGQQPNSARKEFFYFSDDGDLVALRYDNWKAVFAQQRAEGTMLVWSEPFVRTRLPWLFNLRTDPYEHASITSNTYWDWYFDHVYLLVPMQTYVGQFLATFKDYPPRQKAASFTVDQVMESLTKNLGSK
jgi:arylsulfatase